MQNIYIQLDYGEKYLKYFPIIINSPIFSQGLIGDCYFVDMISLISKRYNILINFIVIMNIIIYLN